MSNSSSNNKYVSKGRELIGPIRDWQAKTGGSFGEYNRLAQRQGLMYYTRHWWNVYELHKAFQFLVVNRY